MDLKEEQVLGESIHQHWYYLAKARLLAASVGEVGTVLDVGAGSGFFSRWLLRNGRAQKAICVDPFYEADRDEEEAGKPILFRRSIEACDADLLLMMDVLEHVEDDKGLLGQYLPLLRPGGRCFITVPAFQFLWSAHDTFLEHKRRYTLAQLERTVAAAGAQDVRGHYYYGAVFPIAAGVRLMRRGKPAEGSDLQKHSPPVNAILSGVCSLEQLVMRWNRLAGLSVAVTCAAPAPTDARLAA
ncbi:MAG: class I SAM-dependent methyltransferase [Hyphomonadaceae bacterium]|nr:class I SAM-dependent methyltransferase [Hyphomonadaceae bacterium]